MEPTILETIFWSAIGFVSLSIMLIAPHINLYFDLRKK